MITINLKPGTKRQAPKGDPLAPVRALFKGIREKVREPGLVLGGGALLLVILVLGALYLRTSSRLGTLEPKMLSTQEEYKRYKNFVNAKKREAKARDSILVQIGTISAVDQDRFTWSHILDEIAGAVPDATWLTTIAPVAANANLVPETDSTAAPPVSVLIGGQTSDLQNYTSFLRRLGESHWLTDVVPVKTETVIDKNNRPVTAFTVKVTFSRADSSRIQTVPILESTVR
jgi:Tfp pilus assembly protein PilN